MSTYVHRAGTCCPPIILITVLVGTELEFTRLLITRVYDTIFHTFVRSKNIYGLMHIPISKTLLDLDNDMLSMLFQAVLPLRSKPNSTEVHLLCAILRIRSLPTMREDFIHHYIRKLKAHKDLSQFPANFHNYLTKPI